MNKAGSGGYGSRGDNIKNLLLTDSSESSINSIPYDGFDFTGSYHPSDDDTPTSLSVFNGDTINGTWRLIIEDTFPDLDHGILNKWTLKITHSKTISEKPVFQNVDATNGSYTTGDIISITLSWDKNVIVSGIPQLQLSNGAIASYFSYGATLKVLEFRYTVLVGEDTDDLQVSKYTGIIKDSAGNPAENFSNKDLGSVIIDTKAPIFQNVAATSGTYTMNDTVKITVSWNEDVIVSGTPQLLLSNGAIASYFSHGTTLKVLEFRYTVIVGEDTDDLKVSKYTGTIEDIAGNPAENFSNQDLGSVIIDTTNPSLVSIDADNGTYNTGDTLKITATWNEIIKVSSTKPTLALSNRATAVYLSGDNTTRLIFEYTVSSGEDTNDLKVSKYNGSIKDIAGNPAQNFSNQDLGSVIIDTTNPKFVSVSTSSGDYSVGSTIILSVSWNKNVYINLSSPPKLIFSDGSKASYQSGSGNSKLVFSHTITNINSNNSTPNSELKINSYSGTIRGSGGLAAGQVSANIGSWKLNIT